jgi:hypothetical protein
MGQLRARRNDTYITPIVPSRRHTGLAIFQRAQVCTWCASGTFGSRAPADPLGTRNCGAVSTTTTLWTLEVCTSISLDRAVYAIHLPCVNAVIFACLTLCFVSTSTDTRASNLGALTLHRPPMAPPSHEPIPTVSLHSGGANCKCGQES